VDRESYGSDRCQKEYQQNDNNQNIDEQDKHVILDDHQSESGEYIDMYTNHDKYKNPQDDHDECDKEDSYFEDTFGTKM
jgi:hypothetical protein